MKRPALVNLLPKFVSLWLVFIGTGWCQADWPQILGANRNGTANSETFLKSWPKSGPKRIWKHSVGEGYAGPSVASGKVIVFHRIRGELVVESLDASDGNVNWSKKIAASYSGGIDSDRGPRCVPLIHRDRIYLYSAGGLLFCLNLQDGKSVWKRDIFSDFSCQSGYFGAGSTPIIVDDKLIVNVGGRDAAVAAFDLQTGDTVWTTGDDQASYSSPIVFQYQSSRVVALVSRLNLMLLNPKNGTLLGKTPFGKRGPTVNGASPVFVADQLFVNSAYNVGAKLFQLTDGKGEQIRLKTVWQNDNSFSSQYSTPVFYRGHLFGTSGREDFSNGSFRCVELATGKVKWKTDKPVGHTILANDKILVLDSSGGLHLLDANPEKFVQLESTQLFDGKSRAMPAVSNGLLFARSNGSNGELVCVEIGKRQ